MRPNFLNDNENRAYPLLADRPATMTRSDAVDVELPTDVLVDYQALIGLHAAWRAGVDTVYLKSVHRQDDDTFWFEFETTAPGLAGYAVFVPRHLDGPEYEATRHDASSRVAESSIGGYTWGACGDDLIWLLGLTTGRMDSLADVLPQGMTLTAADNLLPLEQAPVQDLAQSYVASVNCANRNRTHVTAPLGCTALAPRDYADGDYIEHQLCLKGDLKIVPGYNCSLRQNAQDNSLTIAAGEGAGEGVPCGEIPLYPSETPDAGSILLSGGPACNEVVSSVNGVSGAHLRIDAAGGVTVAVATDPNTIVVSFDLNNITACETGSL